MKKIAVQFLTLILLCHSTLSLSQYVRTLNVKVAQKIFQSQFCGGCPIDDKVCSYNVHNISILNEAGNFNLYDLPIQNNKYGVTHIEIYLSTSATSYRFPGLNLASKSMISLVFLPIIKMPRGIVIYYHKTVFGKYNGPSSLGPDFLAIGGLYASQGYAVVIPEYIGFGDDKNSHPFILYPQQNVRSAVHALNQIDSDGLWKIYSESKFPLHSIGYSEGGSYSVWMSKCLTESQSCPYYSNNDYIMNLNQVYDYQKVVGLNGAYDLKGIVQPYLYKDISTIINNNQYSIFEQFMSNQGKASFTALTLISYLEYTQNNLPSIVNHLNYDMFKLLCTGGIAQTDCMIGGVQESNIISALSSKKSDFSISSAISFSALEKTTYPWPRSYLGKGYESIRSSQINSIYALINNTLLRTEEFNKTIENASVAEYGRKITQKAFAFSLEKDSFISSNNTRNFYLHAQRVENPNVKTFVFPNINHQACNPSDKYHAAVDHLRAQSLANIFALNFINNP